jgi:hypothetical protein
MFVVMVPSADPMPVVVAPVNVLRQLRIGVSANSAEAGTDHRRICDISRTEGDSSERRCCNQTFSSLRASV